MPDRLDTISQANDNSVSVLLKLPSRNGIRKCFDLQCRDGCGLRHFKCVSKFLQSRASANRSTETIISLSPQTVCPGSTVTSSRSDEQLELFTRGSSDHPIIGSQAFQLNTPPNESLAPSYPTRRPNFGSTATPRCPAHSIRQKVGLL